MDYDKLESFYKQLDRSFFIDGPYKEDAFLDEPLPIGYGQTISQPSLVLSMTYYLAPEKASKVLEIGTGSGYQTALLAEFSGKVYTVELVAELAKKSKVKLAKLGYSNIFYKFGDGSLGWTQHAPFDRIIVTAAAGKLPIELLNQLKPGGKMIIPVGSQYIQDLQLISKNVAGEIASRSLGKVRFVEMKGEYGWL